MVKSTGKRPAPSIQHPSKKRKLNKTQSSQTKLKTATKKKDTIKKTIDIPDVPIDDEDILPLSDQDFNLLETYGGTAKFLNSLDHKGISRSKQETERLWQLDKPVRKTLVDDDLPAIDSHDEDEGSWDSEVSDDDSLDSFDDPGSMFDSAQDVAADLDSDVEMPYEVVPRKLQEHSHTGMEGPERLPIKLKDGRIQKTGKNISKIPVESSSESEGDSGDEMKNEKRVRDDAATGARFGRLAIIDILENKSRKARIQIAKDQIASICQEILSDPENSLSLLKRLHAFSLPSVSTATHPEPIPNDPLIQKLALLSQLAVYKDIIPGYRIRSLTDKEKSEKVSQAVARTREYEQGLVSIYQNYLRVMEVELKARNSLSETALQCICSLLTELLHFNFRINLMSCVVAQLSGKSWSETSQLCLDTLIRVFRNDLTGTASLEVVRLLNRMIKEKRFQVHPAVLSCLLHLRLKSELGVRASESKADKADKEAQTRSKGKDAARRAKGKSSDQPHLSKKARKALKEKKEIVREFRDAEAEIDKEERGSTHTETLKLLFVLYFGILKNPNPTPLLPAALEGIIKYAHLVNIDFFQDLMKVLRGLILSHSNDQREEANPEEVVITIRHRLLFIVTAFELLSGQGEALNMDLSDFISYLYASILPLALTPALDVSTGYTTSSRKEYTTSSLADMLFRALNIVFSPQTFGNTAPSWRSAAFAKRLLSSCMHWPTAVVVRTLQFVQGLVVKDPRLQALLSTEERSFDGVYRPDLDDPQLSNAFGSCLWEVYALRDGHFDPQVRMEAEKLLAGSP
ncbi:nucleolar complex-associated protein-domain-containing protein [Lentinula detonsa]|uniref:Nucleolar complex-associated protein 3 n=1 Tax=Lentinula detonsa TaxID=2804962 RepID=A0A9W8P0M0_9AGAR|nr:nucleolar complex-associated protein-domain-containing protein [Lentinula detonsa]